MFVLMNRMSFIEVLIHAFMSLAFTFHFTHILTQVFANILDTYICLIKDLLHVLKS